MNISPVPPERVLGNDIVDLLDADSRDIETNRAFQERVFAPSERDFLARAAPEGAGFLALVWALWAGKEAAYKALRAARPELVWSPRAFVVLPEPDLAEAPADARERARDAGGDFLRGVVAHDGGDRLRYECAIRRGEWAHAVCTGLFDSGLYAPDAQTAGAVVRAEQLLPPDDDESRAVRGLALQLYAREIEAAGDLTLEGEIPRFVRAGRALATPLSLSHHGRYVAAAFLAE